ncbi:MAG: ABC transporter permease [Armatimonadota bacterium]|nr:ABC transporter permease [Armatimonadota bacterium]MDR7535019.1 ABC transporter permease [Armatimonadota bacterium]
MARLLPLRAPSPGHAQRPGLSDSRLAVVSLGATAGVLVAWYLVTATGWISTLFLPSPTMVWREAMKLVSSGELWYHVLTSARRVFVGYLLSAAVAIPVGVLMGTSRVAKAAIDPLLSLIRPLPSLSWIPLSILWFGIGESQKYAIVFMGTFAATLLYVAEATKRVDPLLVLAARNLGANSLEIMREVILPGALPGIVSGLKVSLAISWTVVLSAEMVAANRGLGALIWFGKDWNNLALIMVGMALISATVFTIDTLFRAMEGRLIPWERHRFRR